MDAQTKLKLITRNLQETLNLPLIENILKEDRSPRIYWGTAPTGKTHCGYLVPMVKLADYLKADCEVVVLLANLHAFLDNVQAPMEVVNYRVKYYEKTIKAILKSIGVPIEKLTFVVGDEYQLSANYTMDLFRISNVVSSRDAGRAGAEVVKQSEDPRLSGLIYPLMQALDEEYLKVDVQFGGVDQRKIFVLADEQLPKIGYKKRAHLMNPMVPGLTQGGKMSASDPNSKIDLLEDPVQVKKKIAKAFAAPGVVEGNGLLSFVEYVVLPISDIKNNGKPIFTINRDEKWGGVVSYSTIEELKEAYASESLSPADLKIGVTDAINAILGPIRDELLEDKEFAEIDLLAYPPPVAPVKKEKKKSKKVPKPDTIPVKASASAETEAAAELAEKIEILKTSEN